jgi:hypothetical protein
MPYETTGPERSSAVVVGDGLAKFREHFDALTVLVKKSTGSQLRAIPTRQTARNLVQEWFRGVRTSLEDTGIGDARISEIDSLMQTLLRYTQSQTLIAKYVELLRRLHSQLDELEVAFETSTSKKTLASSSAPVVSDFERRLVTTLEALVPSAALSYRQLLLDLEDGSKISYRGTANELRSVLWDVLDRLAPDESVVAAPDFKYERDRKAPTQKQKARFILKSRLGEKSRKTAEVSIEVLEERVGALSRAVYDRSSISTHVAGSRAEVVQVKMYLDTVLSELLEVYQR